MHGMGPAHATVAELKRLGWKAKNAALWTMQDGRELDLSRWCPGTVATLVEKAVGQAHWRDLAAKHPELEHLAHGALIEPLRRMVTGSGYLPSERYRRSLFAAVTGRIWAQADLNERGLAADSACRACGHVNGTRRHLLWACDALAEGRRQWAVPGLMHLAAASDQEDVLWTRALLPDPTALLPMPRAMSTPRWFGPCPDGPILQGHIFTDGSLRYPDFEGMERAGTAAVQIHTRTHDVVAGVYNASTHLVQDINIAEIQAASMALQNCVPPITIWTDSLVLADGYRDGRRACVQGANKYADAWLIFWWAVDEVGGGSVSVQWTKGHATRAHIQSGLATDFRAAGNREADIAAKSGAALHSMPEAAIARCMLSRELVRRIGAWIARALVQGGHLLHRPREGETRVAAEAPQHDEAGWRQSLDCTPADLYAAASEAEPVCMECEPATSQERAAGSSRSDGEQRYEQRTVREAGVGGQLPCSRPSQGGGGANVHDGLGVVVVVEDHMCVCDVCRGRACRPALKMAID